MVQKILLTIEIDDAELDKAQQKADKLIATLERAQALMQRQETDDAEKFFNQLVKAMRNLPYP